MPPLNWITEINYLFNYNLLRWTCFFFFAHLRMQMCTFSKMFITSSVNFFSVFFLFVLQVGWRRRHIIDQWSTFAQAPLHLLLIRSPLHFILGKTHLQTPSAPLLKTKPAFKQFPSQLPQRLKTAKAPLQLSTLPCAPSPYLLWYSLHVFSHCCVLKLIYLPNGSCILCM